MAMALNYLNIFLISMSIIALELFITRILSLKTWNHLVYLIIPFALLGYGIGTNLYHIAGRRLARIPNRYLTGASHLFFSLCGVTCSWLIIRQPLQLEKFIHLFSQADAVAMLLVAYTVVVLPFIPAGFLVAHLFSNERRYTDRLYFVDLVGAGLGTVVFVALISHLGVFHSICLLGTLGACVGLVTMFPRWRSWILVLTAAVLILLDSFPLTPKYAIDPAKGWENIEGFLEEEDYDMWASEWSPLGRTDIFRIHNTVMHAKMMENAYFQINVRPAPELAYIVNDSTAGTPVFHMSQEGRENAGAQLVLFSQPFEVPYITGHKDNVVIIGAGGGRDLHIARSHGARNIVAAEINPVTYRHMLPGGVLGEFSGNIYTAPGVRVANVDGRHLVKTLPAGAFDLIILTGVDTFSGLNNGAYTYAESYLYTQNAVTDYLRILNEDGILNFNRRYFPEQPREGLRLFSISLAALKASGAPTPWDHILVGGFQKWSILLVKKTPFTPQERATVTDYFLAKQMDILYPNPGWEDRTVGENLTAFDRYARAFRTGEQKAFEASYPYDVSTISDDNPFFYKYYKFNIFNPFRQEYDRHTGTLIFITQLAVLAQAIVFILLFIFLPLYHRNKSGLKQLPAGSVLPFVVYFSCLGTGFMFLEIPLMQKFVLILGSPIYSISVTLAGLLIFTGLGSYCLKFTTRVPMAAVTVGLLVYGVAILTLGQPIAETVIGSNLSIRVLTALGMLGPLGLMLGIYFPKGLTLTGEDYPDTIAWGWGINCGFSVLGSILAIIVAQFAGFNAVLIAALFIYGIGTAAFVTLTRRLSVTESSSSA